MIVGNVVRGMLTSFAIVETLNFLLYSDNIRVLNLSGVFFHCCLGGIVEGKRQQNAYRSFGQGPVNEVISEILANFVTLNVQKRAQSEK